MECSFKVEQTPSARLYLLIVWPCWLVVGVTCGILSHPLPAGWSLLVFPVIPIVAIFAVIDRLLAPCIVRTDREGFTIEVLRGSLNIARGLSRWSWEDLRQFQYSGGRGRVLRLWRDNGTILNFSSGDFGAFHDYLRQHFPEKEKHSWWSSE